MRIPKVPKAKFERDRHQLKDKRTIKEFLGFQPYKLKQEYSTLNPLIVAAVTVTGGVGFFSFIQIVLFPQVLLNNAIGFILSTFYLPLNEENISTRKKWWQSNNPNFKKVFDTYQARR